MHKREENEIKEIENCTATFAELNALHRVSFHLNCTRFFGTCHKKVESFKISSTKKITLLNQTDLFVWIFLFMIFVLLFFAVFCFHYKSADCIAPLG